MTAKKKTERIEELNATAYHEAGHAVLRLAQGLTIDTVSIVPGERYNGSCDSPNEGYCADSDQERTEIARMTAIASYAGMPAQRLVDKEALEVHGSADDDNALDMYPSIDALSKSWPTNCSGKRRWTGKRSKRSLSHY